MTDKELLEWAAKAAGETLEKVFDRHACEFVWNWNPLTDDGDALRLAVKLGLHIDIQLSGWVEVLIDTGDIVAPMGNDPYAATRRAITRAAAEIGKVSQ